MKAHKVSGINTISDEDRRRKERERKAFWRASKRELTPDAAPTKQPGSFASFIKVKEIRRSSKNVAGVFFVDMAVGPYFFRGQRYDARKGQLQWTSRGDQRIRLSNHYYTSVIRPMVIAAIEDFMTTEQGEPTTLPDEYQFKATPTKEIRA
jgi:hypothetical protein